MRFVTDKIEWTTAMKEYVETVLTKKMSRLLDDVNNAQVKVTKINVDNFKVDINLNPYRAQSVKKDFYDAVNDAASKLKSIVTKDKKKETVVKEMHTYESMEYDTYLNDLNVSKEKVFNMNPQTIDEAIDYLEKTDYSFYVFKDVDDNERISILYRRYDNTFGLIRCR